VAGTAIFVLDTEFAERRPMDREGLIEMNGSHGGCVLSLAASLKRQTVYAPVLKRPLWLT